MACLIYNLYRHGRPVNGSAFSFLFFVASVSIYWFCSVSGPSSANVEEKRIVISLRLGRYSVWLTFGTISLRRADGVQNAGFRATNGFHIRVTCRFSRFSALSSRRRALSQGSKLTKRMFLKSNCLTGQEESA